MKAIVAIGLLLGLLSPRCAFAGLYCTQEPPQGVHVPSAGIQAMKPDRFVKFYLLELNQIANPRMADEDLKRFMAKYESKKTSPDEKKRLFNQLRSDLLPLISYYPLWDQYSRRKDELERKARRGQLSLEDRINLSFYLLRLGRSPEEVLGLLKVPEVQAQRHFMVYANLATAYERQAAGAVIAEARFQNLRDALLYRQLTYQALVAIKKWPGWSAAQLEWYRTAEKSQTKLVRLRMREAGALARRSPRGNVPLFDKVDALFDVTFAGEEPTYEAGTIAPAERGKLKGDEVGLVQQLLAWSPSDNRLYWLLGELLNAQGQTKTAAYILEDCVKNRGLSTIPLVRNHRNILNEAVARAAAKPAAAPNPASGWPPPTWQLVLAGSVAAVVLAFLAYFQIKELRRRRRHWTPAGPKT